MAAAAAASPPPMGASATTFEPVYNATRSGLFSPGLPRLPPLPYESAGVVTRAGFMSMPTMFDSPVIDIPIGGIHNIKPGQPHIPAVVGAPFSTLVEYESVNNDPEVQRKMVKKFYEKTLNSWIHHDMSEILDHLKIGSDGKVTAMRKAVPSDKESKVDRELKIEFLKRKIFTPEFVHKVLNKFTFKYGTNWFDLWEYDDDVKEYLTKKIKHILKERASD
jgi:hypothetical protein